MSIDIDDKDRTPRSGNKALAGMVLMVIGIAFLIKQINFFFIPNWLFSGWWLFVLVGLYIGVRNNFRNIFWIVLVVIGGLNILGDMLPRVDFNEAIAPLIIIVIGVRMISNRNRPWGKGRWREHAFSGSNNWRQYVNPQTPNPGAEAGFKADPGAPFNPSFSPLGDDYLDATSIFSGVKRKILSKDFKGGEITNFFGGCDVDFTSADINGRVVIDVTQVFGGIKLIVPPHWHVTSDMISLFAGFDDKRLQKSDYGSDKILVLKGTSVFAGVEIRSY